MSEQDVYILGGARTAVGAFQGSLGAVPATQLGSVAIQGALERSGASAGDVDETYMGNVLSAGVGQAPARQAALGAGIPNTSGATTVSKVCGSGLMSVVLGTKSLRLGDAELVVAGGMESMTQAPYLLPKARGGYRMGHGKLLDAMIHDGLWDPYDDVHMGQAAELCAREYGFAREAQDDVAELSYKRALEAQEKGLFAQEIVPVTIEGRKGSVTVEVDDEPGRARFDKMRSLRPAFEKEGTITAANASKLNDGAAAVVLASGQAVKSHGFTPKARVLGYGTFAHEPAKFTTAPVGAIKRTLGRLNLRPEDIDLWEVNEAFAVVPMACVKDIGLPEEKLNVRGGAIALGHPIGASGARILVTLLAAMAEREAKRGLATLCIGGGEAVALVVERV